MFARIATVFTFLFFILPALSAAAAVARGRGGGGGGGGGSVNQCNVGAVQCCNTVQSSDSTQITHLAGLFGLDFGPHTTQVGVNCNPVTVAGAGGNSCSAQPVCCTGNHFNGLINVGCSPTNINL